MSTKQFIVIEGIDASGKSTQAELLQQHLINSGGKAVISSEPSNGIIGNLIRQALKQRVLFSRDEKLFDEQMAYLFASDRHDHLYNDSDGVYKLMADGFDVISTRYYFSSLAYNSETPEQFEFIAKLNHKFPPPNVTIYLDLQVEAAMARMKQRSSLEVYETKEKLTLVKENYQRIFQDYSGRLLTIDALSTIDAIHLQIKDFVSGK